MKILILDDDLNRASKLQTQIARETGIDISDITAVPEAYTALEKLKKTYFDVLVIDVVIPRRENETASARNGLDLLKKIDSGSGLRKPGRIVGITANITDIEKYRKEFSDHCVAVIQATPGEATWRSTVCKAITNQRDSSISKTVSNKKIEVLTIHGIQTFGSWQDRLRRMANDEIGEIEFGSYKYGLFSIFAFLIPPLRKRECNRLIKHLRQRFKSSPGKRFIVFSHSFGTYLTHSAIKALLLESEGETSVPVDTIVLSGSVLRHQTDWTLFSANSIRIVNDCADHDYVLYLSQFFVWGVGMAGRCGFYGFNDRLMVNRHFNGGHSSYFEGDDFMRNHWIPLISQSDQPIPTIDHRRQSFIRHSIVDKLATTLGRATTLLAYSAVVTVIFLIAVYCIR